MAEPVYRENGPNGVPVRDGWACETCGRILETLEDAETHEAFWAEVMLKDITLHMADRMASR